MASFACWPEVERRARPGDRPAPLAAPAELAKPGVIRLQALREQGQVVGFDWAFADSAAARQLRCQPDELQGHRPVDVIARKLDDPALFDRYRAVLELGEPQVFLQLLPGTSPPDRVLHRVVRRGDGITVTLTNLSADQRTQARRLGIREPHATDPNTGS